MSFFRTDDPIADFDRYDAEQHKLLESCDSCDWCGEKIISDCYYDIKGDKVCEGCIDECRHWY